MEPEPRYKLIGGSVLLLMLAASLVAVWISRAGVGSEFRFYTIHFQSQSLEGLQVGGDVNMQGIKVGRVESFSIDRNNINRVNVLLRVGRLTPVSTNTTASIARNLVTGIARINLDTPGMPGPPLEDVPDGESYPVIAEGTSDLDQLTRSANNLVISAERSFVRLGQMLDDANRETFAQALAGLRDLSVGLAGRLERFDRTADSIGGAADALARTATSLRESSEAMIRVVERLGARAEPVATQAERMLGEANTTLREVRSAVKEMSASTIALEAELAKLARGAQGAADVGALELRATAQQLRSGVEQLSRTLDRLQDPRSVLVGPNPNQLGPGEGAR